MLEIVKMKGGSSGGKGGTKGGPNGGNRDSKDPYDFGRWF